LHLKCPGKLGSTVRSCGQDLAHSYNKDNKKIFQLLHVCPLILSKPEFLSGCAK